MKKTLLTLATLAALSSGDGEIGNMVNGAEQVLGKAVLGVAGETVNQVGALTSGTSVAQTSRYNNNTYAAATPSYKIKAKPYNISKVKFSSNSGGFGGSNSFGF